MMVIKGPAHCQQYEMLSSEAVDFSAHGSSKYNPLKVVYLCCLSSGVMNLMHLSNVSILMKSKMSFKPTNLNLLTSHDKKWEERRQYKAYICFIFFQVILVSVLGVRDLSQKNIYSNVLFYYQFVRLRA